ncbi:MAG: hypothetical protein CEN92_114 [Candidatus Berkelbacteria bacterium Licking1014_96]|uniref:Uncharacterized protein n=1 Tax=Candidatus Berkelbacteria bacterium Licking1014_96 TaxID=2017149 RepID=A0A554LGZ5_9BACT|nr:MAG: hypothetical protein CEN92_114 [Candidatus Berkelbacteria bacterium Licking1014_96]
MAVYVVDVWTPLGRLETTVVAESERDIIARVFANEVTPKLDPSPSSLGLTANQFSRRVSICGPYRVPTEAVKMYAD